MSTSPSTGEFPIEKTASVKAEAQEGVGNRKESVPLQSINQNDVTAKLEVEVDCDPTGYGDEVVSLADPIKVSDDAGLEDGAVTPGEEGEDHSLANSQPPSDPKYMESIQHVLADIGEIKALETPVAHLQLGYMGTFDCLAEYKGTLCLIDWKTSNKPKSSLADCYDYPLQAVAYAGAINQDPHLNLKVRM